MTKIIFNVLSRKNRKKLQKRLGKDSLAVFFSNHKMPKNGDQYFPYRQNSDLFYLTGIKQPETILLISPEDEILFIQKPNPSHSLWGGDSLSPEKASKISDIANIKYTEEFREVFHQITVKRKAVYFNTALKITDVPIKSRDENFLKWFRETYPFHQPKSIRPIMKKLRMVKEPEEIEQITDAINITERVFMKLFPLIKAGVNEKELEAKVRYEFMKQGCDGPAYDPIIASGENACILHYINNNSICAQEDLLLMDIGAESNYYAADITRTVPVSGKFNDKQREYYQAVLEVMEETIQKIKPGINLKDLNSFTRERLTEKHIELGLYTKSDNEDQQLSTKYFPHGVSHFMGLDVHDYGDKETSLEKGMVLTCEPGLYIPEENIGIRIEDDILVDEKPINLSGNIPKTVETIEKLMNTN
ncbi:MAG: Xaa-Pro aminopeptidase [Bacteroidales bacterium]